jgi:alpha-ketoglutarate-dependent 2,4-dichlorophenoxyacetate dioxygenase
MAIQVRQVHPLFVGEVSGIDLRRPADEGTLGAIQAAIDRYAVLVFPGQSLDDAEQIAFAERFGPLERSTLRTIQYGASRLGHDALVDVSNLDERGRPFAQGERRQLFSLGNRMWHTDSSFKRVPGKYSFLHARTIPSRGGETEYTDLRAVWDSLPEETRASLEGLVVEHSLFYSHGAIGFMDFSEEERAALPPVPQPLVRTLSESGRKTLYLASHASHVIGWPVPEGRVLLRELIEVATQREFVYQHRWRVGDLVMWDNRCTMHRVRPYDQGERRDMRRVTVTVADVGAAGLERRLAS